MFNDHNNYNLCNTFLNPWPWTLLKKKNSCFEAPSGSLRLGPPSLCGPNTEHIKDFLNQLTLSFGIPDSWLQGCNQKERLYPHWEGETYKWRPTPVPAIWSKHGENWLIAYHAMVSKSVSYWERKKWGAHPKLRCKCHYCSHKAMMCHLHSLCE